MRQNYFPRVSNCVLSFIRSPLLKVTVVEGIGGHFQKYAGAGNKGRWREGEAPTKPKYDTYDDTLNTKPRHGYGV